MSQRSSSSRVTWFTRSRPWAKASQSNFSPSCSSRKPMAEYTSCTASSLVVGSSYMSGVTKACTALRPLSESSRYMTALSIMFASQGLLVHSQQLPRSGYSCSTATPTSVSGSVHMSCGMPTETLWSM